jgi:HSP20 family protein
MKARGSISKRFNSIVDQFLNNGFSEGFSIPAINHDEDDHNYYLKLITPGLKKEELNLRLNDCILTVYANEPEMEAKKHKSFSYKDACRQFFNRSFVVPGNININAIRAKFKDGVLNITLPKKSSYSRWFEPKDLAIE